jgi:DnaJ-domain-containing protein 1
MSSNEMLVIVGGLFFGYLIVTLLMNPKKSKPSEQSENSHSSQNKSEKTNSSQKENARSNSSQHSSHKHSSAKDDYVPASWFRILEVSESASMSEISTQYKRKIREYHPDKVASLGKELRELAEFKSKEINSAYDFAKKLKG